jgi:phosphotransferase system enzyme I (PtsI)
MVRLADGTRVDLLATVSSIRAVQALPADVAGVGLVRTEHLFGGVAPAYERQREMYRLLFERLAGRLVVVRTFDALDSAAAGTDPFAVRGVRRDRRDPAVLDTQLAAISAAAATAAAQVWVMAPMVATAEEARWFAVRAARHGLDRAGVMVEVPAAALGADQILPAVRFASIGTNDLSQYLFAADRADTYDAELLDPWQPALLRLVRAVVRSGALLRRLVSVCGAAAADPALAVVLVGLGVTQLSMPATDVAAVRRTLRACTLRRCRMLGARALRAPTARAARTWVRANLAGHR